MASQPNVLLSAEEYLAIEEKAEYKSEYFDGEMYAMSGVSRTHDIIVGNVLLPLLTQLKGTPCHVHTSDCASLCLLAARTFIRTYPSFARMPSTFAEVRTPC
jgi:Uma2 family endonuclease